MSQKQVNNLTRANEELRVEIENLKERLEIYTSNIKSDDQPITVAQFPGFKDGNVIGMKLPQVIQDELDMLKADNEVLESKIAELEERIKMVVSSRTEIYNEGRKQIKDLSECQQQNILLHKESKLIKAGQQSVVDNLKKELGDLKAADYKTKYLELRDSHEQMLMKFPAQ